MSVDRFKRLTNISLAYIVFGVTETQCAFGGAELLGLLRLMITMMIMMMMMVTSTRM